MIKLNDGTEWPDEDYHAKMASELGCTRAQAKSWLMAQNYSKGTVKFEIGAAVTKTALRTWHPAKLMTIEAFGEQIASGINAEQVRAVLASGKIRK